MSEEDREWKGCLRKNRYDTYLDAVYAADWANKRSGHGTIVTYECEYGDHYHIGHATPLPVTRCPNCNLQIGTSFLPEHQFKEHNTIV